MPFEKGHKKYGGRQKGTPNKSTLAKKEELEQLFNDNGGFEELFNDIEGIEDKAQKVNAKLKLIEFFMAKHKSVEINNDSLFGNIRIIEDDGTGGTNNTD